MSTSIRLIFKLRFIAGGIYLDHILAFRLAESTVYSVFHSTVRAILDTLSIPGVPLTEAGALKDLYDGFICLRAMSEPLYGCIEVLYGIAIDITKPQLLRSSKLLLLERYVRNSCTSFRGLILSVHVHIMNFLGSTHYF